MHELFEFTSRLKYLLSVLGDVLLSRDALTLVTYGQKNDELMRDRVDGVAMFEQPTT